MLLLKSTSTNGMKSPNACRVNPCRQSPRRNANVARVSPQPGHGIPNVCSSGQRQPGKLKYPSNNCNAPIASSNSTKGRFLRIGARIGANRFGMNFQVSFNEAAIRRIVATNSIKR